MRLKHIYLYVNLEEYPKELATAFGFATRYFCNFIERQIGGLKFDAKGFSKICIQGCHDPEKSSKIVSERALLATVPFDQARYLASAPYERSEMYAAMLKAGFEQAARDFGVPYGALEKAIQEFRNQGFKNEWIHQRKLFRPLNVQAYLCCSLNSEKFFLTLTLEREGKTVYSKLILETLPDEMIFGYRFKEVVMMGDDIIVKDKFGDPAFTLNIADVLVGNS